MKKHVQQVLMQTTKEKTIVRQGAQYFCWGPYVTHGPYYLLLFISLQLTF